MTNQVPIVISIAGNQNCYWSDQDDITRKNFECSKAQISSAGHRNLMDSISNIDFVNRIENSIRENFFKESHKQRQNEIINLQHINNDLKSTSQDLLKSVDSKQYLHPSVNYSNNLTSTSLNGDCNLVGINSLSSYTCNIDSDHEPRHLISKKNLLLNERTSEGQIINCEKCDELFVNIFQLQKHSREKRHYLGWFCFPCNILFHKIIDFIQHECKYKQKGFITWENLEMVIGNEERVWQCPTCFQLFFGPSIFEKHSNNCMLKCSHCNEIFKMVNKLLEHEVRCSLNANILKQNININFSLIQQKTLLSKIFPAYSRCNNCLLIICSYSYQVLDHERNCKRSCLGYGITCFYCGKTFSNAHSFHSHYSQCIQYKCSEYIFLDENYGLFFLFCKFCKKKFDKQNTNEFFCHLVNCKNNQMKTDFLEVIPQEIVETAYSALSVNHSNVHFTVDSGSYFRFQDVSIKKEPPENDSSVSVHDNNTLIPVNSFSVPEINKRIMYVQKDTDIIKDKLYTDDDISKIKNTFSNPNNGLCFKKCLCLQTKASLKNQLQNRKNRNALFQNGKLGNSAEMVWGMCEKCKINFVPIINGICTICNGKTRLIKNISYRKQKIQTCTEMYDTVNISTGDNVESDAQMLTQSITIDSNLSIKKPSVNEEIENRNPTTEEENMEKNIKIFCKYCGHVYDDEAQFNVHPCDKILKHMKSCFVRIEKYNINSADRSSFNHVLSSVGLRFKDNFNKNRLKCDYCNVCFAKQCDYDYHACFLSDQELMSMLKSCSILKRKRKGEKLIDNAELKKSPVVMCEKNPVADVCQKSLVADLCKKSPVAVVCQKSPVADLCQKSPVADLCQKSPVADLCQKSPVADLCKKTPVAVVCNYSNEEEYACSRCCAVFPTQKLFDWHIRTHDEYRPHVCPICQSRFKRSSNLKEHLRFFHMKGRVPCLKCDKVFPNSTRLREHTRTHTLHYKWVKRKINYQSKMPVECLLEEISETGIENLEQTENKKMISSMVPSGNSK